MENEETAVVPAEAEVNTAPAQDESQFITLMRTSIEATPGFLKLITDEVHPDLRIDSTDARSKVRQDVMDGDADILRKPDTFVLHAIVAIEPHPVHDGLYRASTAEGDFIDGSPKALWDRLTEHQK